MHRVRHFRDIFLKVFKCLRMHANTLCGIFGISETYLPLISKTASEPTRHLFTSFDTFQSTKIQNYFPDLFQQKWEENQSFSEPHSKISTARPANQQTSFQANLCSSRVKSHVSTTNHVLGSDRSCVPGRAERDTPRVTPYAPEPYRISCVKPDSQGQLDGCWKDTKFAALISSLQGSVRHPALAQVSADNFQLASAVYYCFCTYILKSYFKAAQLSRHQI